MMKFYYLFNIILLLFSFNPTISAELSQLYSHPSQPNSASDSKSLNNNHRELIIKIRLGNALHDLKKINKGLGIETIKPIFNPASPAGQHSLLSRYYILQFDVNVNIQQILQMYLKNPMIENVQMNTLNQFCAEKNPNDPRYIEQWNLKTIDLRQAWNVETGNSSVIIAVVDSGIKKDHPELRNQLWQNVDEISFNGIDDDQNGYVDDIFGWDFTDAPTFQGVGDSTQRDNDPEDETGHGTHVAGIIAAETNNGIGIAGIAWGCKLMPLRAGFRLAGGGAFLQNDDVAAAIVYAADNGADIINLSLGDTVNAFIIQDAVEYSYSKGCIIIAAAGNSAEPGAYYPAALENVVSVAALDNNLHLGGSNFGSSIDIAAPGEDILSSDIDANGQGYAIRSGTSMATAHVSGVAALLKAANPSCNNSQVKQWLIGTAKQLSIADLVGAGIVNAYAALTEQINLTADISTTSIPIRNDGEDPSYIEIFGTAAGSGFTQFWFDYGISETPELWFPIGIAQTEQKYNTVLHSWNISALDEGIYTIRLSVKAENGLTLRDKVLVEIRNKTPLISKHESGVWLSRNTYESTIIWHTDVLTTGIVEVFSKENVAKSLRVGISDSINFQHIVNLSETGLHSGEYLYQLKSQNRSGSVHIDDNDQQFYQIMILEDEINSSHLHRTVVAQQGFHGIATTLDINNNGQVELIGVPTGTTQRSSPQILEMDVNRNLKNIVALEQHISRIWDTGDTDGDGLIEILCSTSSGSLTATFLLEQPSPEEYPSQLVWEVEGIWGGTIADMDSDSKPEIFSRHDATNAIWVYESIENNTYLEIAKLQNPTKGMNVIGTKFAIGDFDADGLNEIIAGDNDGDMYIYESIGDNQYKQTWMDVMPDSIPLLFASGDMNGDGKSEFAIGAKAWTVGIDLPRQHWLLRIYQSTGDDSYNIVWNQRIRQLQDGESGLNIADADSDGKNELCIAVPPNFYLIQFDGFSFQPIWHHPATSTFNPIVTDVNADGKNELLFNVDNVLTVFEQSFVNESSKPSTIDISGNAAPSPRIMSAEHVSANQISLTFNSQMGKSTVYQSRYRLLRRSEPHQTKDTDSEQFTPQSVIIDRTGKRVVLTFSSGVLIPGYTYQLETFHLSDINGTEIAEDASTITVEYIEASNSNIAVYPNPARGDQVTFDRLPAGSRLYIYDVSGNCIVSLKPEDDIHFTNRCRKIWSLKNVSSGIYIYILESNAERKIGKISVLR